MTRPDRFPTTGPDQGRRRQLAGGLRLGLAALSLPWLGLSPARAAEGGEATGPAPDFDLGGPAGRVQLSALRGKVVYLDFWASWCGPCRQSFPWMNEIQAKLGPRGLQVVGINVDARTPDAERFLSEVPARFTVAFDPKGETPRRYAIKGMPTSVLIGADGRIRFVHSGFRPEDRAALEAQLQQALAQAEPLRQGGLA